MLFNLCKQSAFVVSSLYNRVLYLFSECHVILLQVNFSLGRILILGHLIWQDTRPFNDSPVYPTRPSFAPWNFTLFWKNEDVLHTLSSLALSSSLRFALFLPETIALHFSVVVKFLFYLHTLTHIYIHENELIVFFLSY